MILIEYVVTEQGRKTVTKYLQKGREENEKRAREEDEKMEKENDEEDTEPPKKRLKVSYEIS
jgi:hypothetical protein